MIKDVIIDIKSTQQSNDEKNTMELTTEGRFGFKDKEILLLYDEGEMLGIKGVKTRLHIKNNNSVIIQRTGSLESRLLIEKGKRNTCLYSMPYGDTLIGMYGEKIENSMTADGGSILIEYTIDTALQLISKNTVKITVREVK